jgi:hypothetical protein
MKLRKLYIILILFSTIFLICCTSENKNINSFYIWNTNLRLNDTDLVFFEKNKIQNLYIRFFDVVWENNYKPIAELQISDTIPNIYNVIPVVYIKNEVLKNLSIAKIYDFADKLTSKIISDFKSKFYNHNLTEIQIDCDWTETTQEKYFLLLTEINKLLNKNVIISVTIRLHQLKYQKSTGIPPVKKGVLMYYNMGEIKDFREKNSILNNNIGKQYINNKTSYPIQLSLAIPIFSWSIWFNYQHKFMGVLYTVNQNNIEELNFLEKQNDNIYVLNIDTVIENYYLRKGDILRIESINIDELNIAKEICKPILTNKFEIILYNYTLKNKILNNYETVNEIFNRN